MEGAGVFLAVEVVVFKSPMGPAACKAAEGLTTIGLTAENRIAIGIHFRLATVVELGNSGFAEVFLCQHVGGDLAPILRNDDVVLMENRCAIRIANLGCPGRHRNALVRAHAFCGKATLNLQTVFLFLLPLPVQCESGLHRSDRTVPGIP